MERGWRLIHTTPSTPASVRRRYTRAINFREGVRGHLFQERFFSCAMDEAHTIAAMRYVERNPVKADIVREAWEYTWSSPRFHVDGRCSDWLVEERYPFALDLDWRTLLCENPQQEKAMQQRTRTGRPLGSVSFLDKAERMVGRCLRRKKPGPKRDK